MATSNKTAPRSAQHPQRDVAESPGSGFPDSGEVSAGIATLQANRKSANFREDRPTKAPPRLASRNPEIPVPLCIRIAPGKGQLAAESAPPQGCQSSLLVSPNVPESGLSDFLILGSAKRPEICDKSAPETSAWRPSSGSRSRPELSSRWLPAAKGNSALRRVVFHKSCRRNFRPSFSDSPLIGWETRPLPRGRGRPIFGQIAPDSSAPERRLPYLLPGQRPGRRSQRRRGHERRLEGKYRRCARRRRNTRFRRTRNSSEDVACTPWVRNRPTCERMAPDTPTLACPPEPTISGPRFYPKPQQASRQRRGITRRSREASCPASVVAGIPKSGLPARSRKNRNSAGRPDF